MSLETKSFEFGEFLLDAREKVLLCHGKPLSITPKAFQLLHLLVENHGHLVERNELLNTVWADSFVEEGNLTFTIRLLRKALNDSKQNPRFIETVPKRGYRFIAEVRQIEAKERNIGKFELIENPNFSSPKLEPYHSEIQPSGTVVALADWRHERVEESETGNFPPEAPKLELVQPLPPIKPKYNYVLAGLVAVVIVLTLGYGFYFLKSKNSPSVFHITNLTRLTSNGKTKLAVISPDGKFIAYILEDDEQQSIWLKNIATGSDVQILPPAEETRLSDLAFSPDGNHIYYSAKGSLYQLPILGGLPKIIFQNFGTNRVYNSISFSPDGKRFAFIRSSSEGAETSSLIIADSDGANERVLASSKRPELLLGSADWSPDGKAIAVTSSDGGKTKLLLYKLPMA